jgi:hypothetical protein
MLPVGEPATKAPVWRDELLSGRSRRAGWLQRRRGAAAQKTFLFNQIESIMRITSVELK